MLVGLVANPLSSKDIRRITGLARVIDIEEKANIVARLLTGIGSVPGVSVVALDDASGLVRRAVGQAGREGAPIEYLDLEPERSETDTRRAAHQFQTMGARAIVTVGGDGTVRAAAEGWARAPLVPVAAGTNNAFALSEEPTILGRATALAVSSDVDAFRPTAALQVHTAGGDATAVIDAVVVKDRWVGAGAIWDPAQLIEGVVTSARPTAVGIAAVGAALGSLHPLTARRIVFGGSHSVRAVFGPGIVRDVPVADFTDVPIGTDLPLPRGAGLVALDGERRLPAEGGFVTVVPGPQVLDPERAISPS